MAKLPTFKLIPEASDDAARQMEPFKWAPQDVGKRHKLGGDPDFVRNRQWPTCGSCRKEMSFYGQLDSLNDDFCIADCGMIYVFLCFGCYETSSIIQSG